jgi:hypothetical protein
MMVFPVNITVILANVTARGKSGLTCRHGSIVESHAARRRASGADTIKVPELSDMLVLPSK